MDDMVVKRSELVFNTEAVTIDKQARTASFLTKMTDGSKSLVTMEMGQIRLTDQFGNEWNPCP